MSLFGVGPVNAGRILAEVGDVTRFDTPKKLMSYLGLTPRESSSGLRRRLGAISKRGDSYLRMLLIHGGRSVLWHAKARHHPGHLQRWGLQIERQRGHNKAAVALANKLTRIVWAVWRNDTTYIEAPALG